MKKPLLFFMLLFFASCFFGKKVHRLIDQKEDSIWVNTADTVSYRLIIDENQGIWFTGRIILNDSDTILLKGFEKGNNHPTQVFRTEKDSLEDTELGYIFIWAKGKNADTLEIRNDHDRNGLPPYLELYRQRRPGLSGTWLRTKQ